MLRFTALEQPPVCLLSFFPPSLPPSPFLPSFFLRGQLVVTATHKEEEEATGFQNAGGQRSRDC